MMLLGVAALVFVAIVTVIVGIWWVRASGDSVRRRLARQVEDVAPERQLLRADAATSQPGWERLARKSDLVGQLARLSEQAGSRRSASQLLLIVAVVAVVGGIIGGWRIGSAGGALISAVVAGALPILQLLHKRNRRLQRFQEHFADAVDMVSRSIRSGNALSAAIQLVSEEMADPIGHEFRHVTEEIRLGLDPGEALLRLQQRVATDDVEFFCTAIRIQRGSGGNLAEILDRLSDVIRKRFELLSHARVLSAQQRYAAIFVGLSPALFSLIFYFLSPGYFDPLIESPMAPMLVGAGLSLEVVGALIIWRLAKIKV
ncbi:MAG TPA: type II secretion system F family protein [Candidatus Acidoferrum sp.]|jgi:tight adherence protein B|nr:type II secretion system F family protein [Candidatus Acidoferrum sp.]